MIYVLILTVFLGIETNSVPITTKVSFSTAEECLTALETATFNTPLPYTKASAVCEKRTKT